MSVVKSVLLTGLVLLDAVESLSFSEPDFLFNKGLSLRTSLGCFGLGILSLQQETKVFMAAKSKQLCTLWSTVVCWGILNTDGARPGLTKTDEWTHDDTGQGE